MTRRPGVALAVVVAATLCASVGTGTAAFAENDYPSWADVQAAKNSEASKKAEIARIEKIISGLETTAADFTRVALEKGEQFNQARDLLDAATVKADTLSAQADAARTEADASATRAGQLVAQLARTGGGDVTVGLILSGDGAEDLLYKLGTLSKLTEQSAAIYRQATNDRNAAAALTGQAAVAKSERGELADAAQKVFAEAEAAAKDAEARVEEQRAASAQLYAQLASLKGTTASTEQGYLDGLAWEAAQNAIKNPPAPAPPVNPTPPPPSAGAVAGAIAFARAQLGEPYQLGGSGPDVWDCSGLTKASYASVGVSIGTHSATNQYATMAVAGRLVPLNDMVAGDLLFYSSGGSTTASKYHVTLYLGGGQMIEAPYPGQPVRIKAVRYGDLVPYAGRPTP